MVMDLEEDNAEMVVMKIFLFNKFLDIPLKT